MRSKRKIRREKQQNFIEMWGEAIEADPYWQFEDLFDNDPREATRVWNNMRLAIQVQRRLDSEV